MTNCEACEGKLTHEEATELANKKYELNHHYYTFLVALATEEGIITIEEKIHLHDSLIDTVASSDQAYRKAVHMISDKCEKLLLDNECEQYSIVAINGDLCWKERYDSPCRS